MVRGIDVTSCRNRKCYISNSMRNKWNWQRRHILFLSYTVRALLAESTYPTDALTVLTCNTNELVNSGLGRKAGRVGVKSRLLMYQPKWSTSK